MKNNKMFIFILLLVLAIICIFFFFRNNETKNFKIGNNTNSQEIVDYILNINSYEAIIEVNVKSNKNENRYKIKQEYKENNNSQEVLEPSNIAGVKIIREGTDLKLENSSLNLTSILQNYEYISDNVLDLNCFIQEYKNGKNSEWKEEDDKILMEFTQTEGNKQKKILYINRQNGLPEKMEIQNDSKNTAVYILYKEVNVNS